MCPPILLAGAAILGAGTAVAGTVIGAKGAKSASDAEKKQAIQNAQYAEQAAQDAIRRGGVASAKARGEGTQLIGTQRVGYAASGVDVSSGSALETQVETRALTEEEALLIKADAARDAWGYRTQGLAYGQQAKLAASAGRQAVAGGFLTGAGQVLGGVASAAGQFYRPARG